MSIGQIVQVIGAVVDIEFPRDEMPKVYDALVLEQDKTNTLAEAGLTFEVQQQLGRHFLDAPGFHVIEAAGTDDLFQIADVCRRQ